MKKLVFLSVCFLMSLLMTPQENTTPATPTAETEIVTPGVNNLAETLSETVESASAETSVNVNSSESSSESSGSTESSSETTAEAREENLSENISEEKLLDSGYDPKNRDVVLIRCSKGFTVKKEQTGFSHTSESEDEARTVFKDQLASTNNV